MFNPLSLVSYHLFSHKLSDLHVDHKTWLLSLALVFLLLQRPENSFTGVELTYRVASLKPWWRRVVVSWLVELGP